MEKELTSAEIVIAKFGNASRLAKLLEIRHEAVYRWTYEAGRGTGGNIPYRHHANILKLSDELNLGVTKEDLVNA